MRRLEREGIVRRRVAAAVLFAAAFAGAVAGGAARDEPAMSLLRRRALRTLAVEVPRACKPDEVRWVGSWTGAIEEAARRNVPVLALLSDDQSAGFQSMEKAVYGKDGFGAYSQSVVLLAAFDGTKHANEPREVDGESVAWCKLFDCPCADHRAAFVQVRDTYARREYWNPLHVFVDAAGTELARAEGHQLTLERLIEERDLARAELSGPSLGYRDYRELLERLRATVEGRARRGGAAVHAELARMVATERKSAAAGDGARPLKTEAMARYVESLQAALLEEAEGLVEEALEAKERGDPAGARKRLADVVRGMKGLEPALRAQRELEKLQKEAPLP